MSRVPLTFRIFIKGKLVREETLALGVIKLGKVPSAHLRIDDESISRMHAILEMSPTGVVHLIDLGSTRGTFVNGQRINKAQIHSGDTIQVGDATVEIAFGAPVAQPTIPEMAPAPAPVVAAPVMAVPPPAPVRPVAPIAVAAVVPAISQPTALFQRHMAEQVEEMGAQAVEVAAMLGDSVVDVKHCMDPRSGKLSGATIGLLAGGAAALLTSAVAFSLSLVNAANNKAAEDYWIHVAKKPAYAYRPMDTSTVVDLLGWAGLSGIGAIAMGLGRARRERKSPFYRIGTAAGVQQPVDGLDNHPLVAPRGDDFVLNLAPGIEGEMIVDGASTPLASLGRPSAMFAGAIEVPIPAKAKIRARAGQTTFMVSSVARPKEQPMPLFAGLSARTAMFFAGSLVAHVGIIGALALAGESSSGVTLDINPTENTGISARDAAHEDPVDEVKPDDGNSDSSGGNAGGQTAMAEGATGTPNSKNAEGHIRIPDRSPDKAISRAQAIEAARSAGVMGSTTLQSSIGLLTGDENAFTSGFDSTLVLGGMFGPEGESFGTGAGRFGIGPGGGCFGGDCGGYGTGKYKTIGTGDKAGDGWGGPGNGNGRLRRHDAAVPTVTISRPTAVDGGLDREIIKRYVKRQSTRISYCYEKQLLAKPNLEGDVVVQFLVMPNGTVQTATGAGMDGEVASCVADAIHDIQFPAPTDGGSVQVKYPFHFQQSGKH